MWVALVREYGEPDVLRFEQIPDPVVGTGEVLVRVAATSVNPFDLHRRAGTVQAYAPIQFPGVVGVDVSGTVQAIGSDVQNISVGDKVFGMAEKTYAELCVVPATSLALVPEGIDLVEAAAIPLVTTTGNLLAKAAALKPGQTVLVTGAVGNVGRSAVYTAKLQGARVIAGVLSGQMQEAILLKADQVIATDDPRSLASLSPLDAVADAVGGGTAEVLIEKVKPGGIFSTVLTPPANAVDFPAVTVVPVFASPDAAILSTMAAAVKSGDLLIPIGGRMPLADAAKAHEAVANGTIHGKLLLVSQPGDVAVNTAEADIRALLAKYNKALNGSDTEAVLPLYTADGIFMAPFSPSNIGHPAIRAAYDNVFATLKFDVVFHLVELVILTADWAFARTNSAGHTTNPGTGKQSSEGNQELFVFRKDADGRWKIARYSFSPISLPRI